MNSRAWLREAMLLRSGAGQESGRAAANGSCSQLLLRIMRTSQTRFPSASPSTSLRAAAHRFGCNGLRWCPLSCSVNSGRWVSVAFAVSVNLRQIHAHAGSSRGPSNSPRRMPLRAHRLRNCWTDRRPGFGVQLLDLHQKGLCSLDNPARTVPPADAVGGSRHIYLQHPRCQTSFLPAMRCGAVLYRALRSR